MSVESVTSLLLLALGVSCLLLRRGRVSGTTLMAPLRWSIFSLLILAATTAYIAIQDVSFSALAAARYLSATSTFCPLMAILGAKRPQNVGWQLIVVTLWIVLILPVGEMLLLWKGGAIDVGPFREWLLVILMLVGFGNYALTRFAMPALLTTIGQGLLLLPHLPVVSADVGWSWLAGIACLSAAVMLAGWQTRKAPTRGGWNHVWIDFRNAFGLVWSLRIMERINGTAKLGNWKNELTWFGFSALQDVSDEENVEIDRAMRTLLRRFVSAEWIGQRSLPGRGNCTQEHEESS